MTRLVCVNFFYFEKGQAASFFLFFFHFFFDSTVFQDFFLGGRANAILFCLKCMLEQKKGVFNMILILQTHHTTASGV